MSASLAAHDACQLEQVGPCVYCKDHGLRLYHGSLPDNKRTAPKCAPGEHDWDPEMGQGFYYLCTRCSEIEWAE
jgi:hypothetical protein